MSAVEELVAKVRRGDFKRMTDRSPHGVLRRIAGAIARPDVTTYTAPTVMTATAVVYALLGYEPYWTSAGYDGDGDTGRRRPGSVAYRIFKRIEGEEDTLWHSHGIGIDVPREFDSFVHIERRIRDAIVRRRAAKLAAGGGR